MRRQNKMKNNLGQTKRILSIVLSAALLGTMTVYAGEESATKAADENEATSAHHRRYTGRKAVPNPHTS